MATANDTRFSDLKARLAALNCELLEDDGDRDCDDSYYVLDKTKGKLVSVGASLKDTYEWVECEEEERGKGKNQPAQIVGSIRQFKPRVPDESEISNSEYALLYSANCDVHDIVDGIRGIANTMREDSSNYSGISAALHVLATKLYSALYDVDPGIKEQIIRQLAKDELGGAE